MTAREDQLREGVLDLCAAYTGGPVSEAVRDVVDDLVTSVDFDPEAPIFDALVLPRFPSAALDPGLIEEEDRDDGPR